MGESSGKQDTKKYEAKIRYLRSKLVLTTLNSRRAKRALRQRIKKRELKYWQNKIKHVRMKVSKQKESLEERLQVAEKQEQLIAHKAVQAQKTITQLKMPMQARML